MSKRPKREGEGRPSKYQKKYCKMLIEHMAKGYSFETFGPSIDVAVATTYRWLTDEPTDSEEVRANKREFREAKIIAVDKCRLFWEKIGIDGMWSEEKGPKLNTSAWIFNMKNRFGWSDRKDSEDTNKIHTVKIELPGQQAQQVITMEPQKIEGETDA
jgi:hypothetical protein